MQFKRFKPGYLCPLALLGLGLWGGTAWTVPAQAASEQKATTQQRDGDVITMQQGTAKVTIDANGTMTIGAGTMTKGKGWCWQECPSEVQDVVAEPGAKVVGDASGMFESLENAGEFDLRHLDVSQVTSLARLFANTRTGEIDVTGWQTGRVTDLSQAFSNHGNWGLKGVDGWDTSQVTTLAETFYRYHARRGLTLDVKNWDTSRVTNMVRTFMGIEDIENIRLDNWDARKVTRCEEFARFEEYSDRVPRMFTFGPNMRFDGAHGVPTFSDSRGWTHRWRNVDLNHTWGALKMPWDSGKTYSARELQDLYTGANTPNRLQTYYLDSLIPKITGHDEKVYDGRPAKLDQSKYQLAALDLPPEYEFELEDGDLVFADGEAPTKPGTYLVTLSAEATNRLLYYYDEDDYPDTEVNVLLSQLHCGTYTITAKDAPTVTTGKVQVNHKSTTGKTLAQETLTGEVGSAYDAKPRKFDQHRFSRVQGEPQGKFAKTDQTVTYWYTPEDSEEGTTGGQPTPGKPEPGKPGPDKPEPGKPEPGKPEPGKPEPGKPEPGKPEPGKPEPGKPEPGKPAPGNPEPGKPEPGKPEPNKPEPGKPAPSKPDKPNPGAPGNGHETSPGTGANHGNQSGNENGSETGNQSGPQSGTGNGSQPGNPSPGKPGIKPDLDPANQQPGDQPTNQPQPPSKPNTPKPNPQPGNQVTSETPTQPHRPTAPAAGPLTGHTQDAPQLPGKPITAHTGDLEAPATTVAVPAGQPAPTTAATVTLTSGLTGATTVPTSPAHPASAQQALPQTSDQTRSWWHLLGAFLLAGTLYCGRRWKNFSKK